MYVPMAAAFASLALPFASLRFPLRFPLRLCRLSSFPCEILVCVFKIFFTFFSSSSPVHYSSPVRLAHLSLDPFCSLWPLATRSTKLLPLRPNLWTKTLFGTALPNSPSLRCYVLVSLPGVVARWLPWELGQDATTHKRHQ